MKIKNNGKRAIVIEKTFKDVQTLQPGKTIEMENIRGKIFLNKYANLVEVKPEKKVDKKTKKKE